MKPTVIICPGNGCAKIRKSNWYGHLHRQLQELNIPSVCQNFPDPHRARREKWVPFIRSLALQKQQQQQRSGENDGDDGGGGDDASSNVCLVGHSSGAQAALRYAEEYPVRAIVLVAATYSDLGIAGERASGYYPQLQQKPGGGDDDDDDDDDNGSNSQVVVGNPYLFDKMKENCPIWHQFHSNDDPFIPLSEAEQIRDGLGLSAADGTYHMLPGRSHFFEPFPELLDVITSSLS